MEFVQKTYEFIIELMRLTVSFLHQIPTGLTVNGHSLDLFSFLVAVTVMTIVVSGIVTVVRAPVDVSMRSDVQSSLSSRREHRREERDNINAFMDYYLSTGGPG